MTYSSPPPESEMDRPIVGQLLSGTRPEPLGGFQVLIEVDGEEPASRVGAAFSQLDGVFSIPLAPAEIDRLAASDRHYTLTVRNRFGREVSRMPGLAGRRLLDPLEIRVEVREADDHPLPAERPDPFKAFQQTFEREIAVLRRAGIETLDRLLDLDLEAFSRQHELSDERLAAFRLAAEVGAPDQLTGNDARLLAAAGITSADALALRSEAEVYRAVRRAADQVSFTVDHVDPERVVGWQMGARGWRTDTLQASLDPVRLAESFQPVVDKFHVMNPGGSVIQLLSSQVGRLAAIAEMRALMEAAGVYDLSGLGAFRIQGTHRIGPGCYIAAPKALLSKIGAVTHLNLLLAKAGGFAKVKTSQFLGDHLHILPNPVRDAVILGSVVEWLEDGKLIVGREVSKLIVITEELRFGVINLIEYEGREEVPQTPAKRPDRPPLEGPEGRNSPQVYTPGRGDNNGREGRRGTDGAAGQQGYDAEAAPSVTIFVKSVPAGLPNINLNGRRGGRGQDGQDGGHGEDGARGRESVSSAFWCQTDVGNGGNGGDGGNGGNGGNGGVGGAGGTIKVFATPENLPRLLSRPGVIIGTTGGPGGDIGSGGAPGDGGQGGWVGNDTGWCDADDGHAGNPGRLGAVGKDKDDPNDADSPNKGAAGAPGAFEVQTITEDDWNAAFTLPYLTRLEPANGNVGQQIHVVGRNFTSDTKLLFDGQLLTPTSIDIAGGTMEFKVPSVRGGVKIVSLSVLVPANPKLRELSSAANFRVQPQVSAVLPARGLPGSTIRLEGTGFNTNSNVRFGDRVFPATLDAGGHVEFTLPDFDVIGMPAGPKTVRAVNPDGQLSNPMTFELETEIVVSVKAWRVLDDDDDGTNRDDDDIRDIFSHPFSPASIWDDHGIRLDFDPNIGVARVSSDLADDWPPSKPEGAADAAREQLLTPTPSGVKYFQEGAINVYFVNDIEEEGIDELHAYYSRDFTDLELKHKPAPVVIFEDTGWLSVEDEAHVLAHEIGHVFGLPHTCTKEDAGEVTTFHRTCNENTDKDYLMYPKTNKWTNEGNALTPGEVKLAKSIARNLHRAVP
jgi:hypothetical protein